MKCGTCFSAEAKYKCPSCLGRTCSVDCYKQHKQMYKCTGIGNEATKYIPKDILKREDTSDAMNKVVQRDYNFLMNMNRCLQVLKQDGQKFILKEHGRNKNSLMRSGNVKLPNMVIRRGVKCFVMPRGMQRLLWNKSKWDRALDTFVWSVEWIVVNARNGGEVWKHISHRNNEEHKLVDCVSKNVFNKCMELYEQSLETEAIEESMTKECRSKLLMKGGLKFYTKWFPTDVNGVMDSRLLVELDPEHCIGTLFKDKTVIEFPTIYIAIGIEGLEKMGLRLLNEQYSSSSDSEETPSSDLAYEEESSFAEKPGQIKTDSEDYKGSEDDYTPGISLDFLAD